ncbi:hypothetical protein PLICRDRAFT_131001, partial [Plicaturopsis crispa FD-325 SS-3]
MWHLFTANVGVISFMYGPSMLPTFREGAVIIEDLLSLRLHPDRLARGDVITLYSPLAPSRIVCKRVLGLPGDIVCVDPIGLKAPSSEHVVVPAGHIWISSDNLSLSRDSRVYGPVSIGLVRGRVWAQV